MFYKDLDLTKKVKLAEWPEGVYVSETRPPETPENELAITLTPEADVYQFVPYFGVRKLVLEPEELASPNWEYVNE